MSPFRIDVPSATLEGLRERLRNTRWPSPAPDEGWSAGTEAGFLQDLVAYWADGFDWRAQEARLNRFSQFRTDVDGLGLHFVHERGVGDAPLPLLLTHGWPDSFWRFERLIPLLTHPEDPADAFDVVAPSIPGYGFSEAPREKGWGPPRIADAFARLMDELGYGRYGAHGGDWGSTITERLARRHPASLVGIHLTDIPFAHLFDTPAEDLSDEEREYLEKGKAWQMAEGGYAEIQSTKPQTLAYGLSDSPAGTLGWIVEKFQTWSDRFESFSHDDLLTNATLYWATNTIGSSVRLYHEAAQATVHGEGRLEVPTGVAIFPKDIVPAPRAFGERWFDVRRWTEMPRGGHFAAFEEPELLAEEIRAFFRPLRSKVPQ